MTENVPPESAVAAAPDQPGRPYYESLRSTLRSTIDKKRKLDEKLAALEEQIYKAEGTYLEDTAGSGNIVRGFDAWVKNVTLNKSAADERRRGRVRDEDRIFSRSSVSWMRAQEGPDSNSTSNVNTPTGSSAGPLSARDINQATAALGNAKGASKKKRQNDDDEDMKTTKRSKITYARE